MAEDKLEKVSKVTRKSGPAQAIEQELARVAPNKESFDDALKVGKQTKGPDNLELKSSLFDEVRHLNRSVDQVKTATPERLAVQAKEVIAQIDDLKTKLETKDLDIKSSVQRILRNKLDHIDDSLKVAMDKAGLEYTPEPKIDVSLQTPINRFLGFLTNGQEQLKTLGLEVESMHLNNKQLSPANLLAIQIKVGYIQQELEFFTSLLNKALESTKTIMNVQV